LQVATDVAHHCPPGLASHLFKHSNREPVPDLLHLLCVPKTYPPDVMVMKTAKDRM
jgi:hypothetical protein